MHVFRFRDGRIVEFWEFLARSASGGRLLGLTCHPPATAGPGAIPWSAAAGWPLRARQELTTPAADRLLLSVCLRGMLFANRSDRCHMPHSSAGSSDELHEALQAFDDAFSGGRLDDVTSLFSEDARLLVHHQPEVSSREAVRAAFARFFEQFEVSAYDPTYEIIDIQDDRAYTLVSFAQVLRPDGGGPGMKVHGRAVQFWRREDGQWRLLMLLTARSAPEEQVL